MRTLPLLALAVVAAALPAASSARVGAALQNNTPPTISGSLHQGSTLTASNGTWSFTPDTFAYQWQRCDSDGSNCNDIRGATSATYTLAAADVSHTLAVDVTASNTFTVNDATSDPTDVVASANGPGADVQPAISGNAQIGQTLSVSTGSWNPPASSFAYQWQLCGGDGSDCLNVSGANKSTFAVTADDAAHTVRALVTAQTAAGEVATAHSNTTGKVPPPPGQKSIGQPTTPTGTTTTPGAGTTTATSPTAPAPAGRRPPTLTVLGLRHSGAHVVASLRVCSSAPGPVTITARDSKTKKTPTTHRFTVQVSTCANLSHRWTLLARLRGPGRLVVTLQARDQTGALSKTVRSSLPLGR
jgi:hypothetical protein